MRKTKATEPPPEISMYVPREVRLTAAGRAIIVVSILLAAAGVIVPTLLFAERERKAQLRDRIQREGIAVEAEVTATGRTGGDNPRRFADYRYAYGDGRVEFRSGDKNRLERGDAIVVRYLPEAPETSWAEGEEPSGPPLPVIPFAAISFFIGPVLIVGVLRRQWRLLAEGRAAVGRVTAVKKKKGAHDRTEYRAEYEITLLSGAVRRIWARGDKTSAEGALVPVVYDPDNPKRLSRYPLPLVTIARY